MADENKSKVQTPWKAPSHGGSSKKQLNVMRMPSNVRPPGTRVTSRRTPKPK
ncbi:hypothetical protein KAR91_04095 [Candidatus Pacearchaeota archaeon]|nr:hypothetical protein [Candidatus Pacearchaeota archaeon]